MGDSRGSRNATASRSAGQEHHHSGTTLSDVSYAQDWGKFAAAVQRHAEIFGPPPAPTEPNRNGAPRLAPAFAEWLLCIPAGHVTDALPRTAALKAIGNGVCPLQLAAAWRLLTAPPDAVDRPSDMSLESHLMTDTAAASAEIHERQAAHRARVVAKAHNALEGDTDLVDSAVQAAMLELAQVWREEAEFFATAKRRGWKSTSEQYLQAAAHLVGFAQGLTSVVSTGTLVIAVSNCPWCTKTMAADATTCEDCAPGLESGRWMTADGTRYPSQEKLDDVSHAYYPFFGCTRHQRCAELPDPFPKPMTVGEAEDAVIDGVHLTAEAIAQVEACVHPDAHRSTLKSSLIKCTLCNETIGQAEQLADLVPGSKRGPVVTGDATLDYLSGAVDEYRPSAFAQAVKASFSVTAGPISPGEPGYRELEHGRPQAPCYECVTVDEDPRPWCDCTPEDGRPCKGPCRLLAHAYTFHPGGCSHRNPFKRSRAATDSDSPTNCMHCGLDLTEINALGDLLAAKRAEFEADPETQAALNALTSTPKEAMQPTPAVDNPFTSPAAPGSNRAPVRRLAWGELGPLTAATYPAPRPHLSHSYVESLSRCGLSALLSDASKAGHLGPRRPSWSLIGGNAFHSAIETIERAAISLSGADPGPAHDPAYWEEFWEAALTYQVDELTASLIGTPYANSSTWHIANKGLEGYDWWRVQGLDMIRRYLNHHDTAWRACHTLLQVPADPAAEARIPGQVPRVPVLELPFSVTAGSTALTTEGFIDAAWLSTSTDYPTATLEVVDYKSGKSLPSEHFQLTEYADVLRRYLPANFGLPVVGRFWRARLGAYTPPIPLPQRAGQDEIDYRYSAAERAMKHAAFAPHPDNMCGSCGSVDFCPAQALRDGATP